MSEVGRSLLRKLLAQVDRGGRDTLPISERSAKAYFSVTDLAGRDAVHAFLRNAEAAGTVTLEWGKGAAAQDLERIRLKDANRLAGWLGVPRSASQADAIERRLAPLIGAAPDWLGEAYVEALEVWRKGGSPYRIPAGDTDAAVRLFHTAVAVAAGRQEGLDLRRFSVQLLGDSKAVEHMLSRLGQLLRRNPEWSQWEEDSELFQSLGLEKFPSPLYIKGPLALRYGGIWTDITPLRPYVALSPDAVADMRATSAVPYLLTVENLASFQRHVREIPDSGIVVYTAGFPAPALVGVIDRLDRCLAAACPCFLWGDRDPGGLRIYASVVSAFRTHVVRPHMMSVGAKTAPGWTQDELRMLRRWSSRENPPGRLARQWLSEGLERLEQEAVDPISPTAPEAAGSFPVPD